MYPTELYLWNKMWLLKNDLLAYDQKWAILATVMPTWKWVESKVVNLVKVVLWHRKPSPASLCITLHEHSKGTEQIYVDGSRKILWTSVSSGHPHNCATLIFFMLLQPLWTWNNLLSVLWDSPDKKNQPGYCNVTVTGSSNSECSSPLSCFYSPKN